MFMNKSNIDYPITALCVVSDKTKCPPNYMPIDRCYDTGVEPDLWRDGIFAKKTNRFICYTKDFPIAETINVIEDLKLLNEKDNMLGGFIPIDRCSDSGDKCLQRKVLCAKFSHRYFTKMAISDIILLGRDKRAPPGFSFIGDINGYTICVKFMPIPDNKSKAEDQARFSTPPVIPPRPMSSGSLASSSQSEMDRIDKSFVHVNANNFNSTNGYNHIANNYPTESSSTANKHSLTSHQVYNPLDGVPFEINPLFVNSNQDSTNENEFEARLSQNYISLNHTLNKCQYDFQLEKTFISSS